jgi:hypothetical protein
MRLWAGDSPIVLPERYLGRTFPAIEMFWTENSIMPDSFEAA